MTYVIEDGVPLPSSERGKGRSRLTETLMAMRPGQSVVVPKSAGRIGGSIQTAKKRGIRYAARGIPGEPDKCRVWVLENPLLKDGDA